MDLELSTDQKQAINQIWKWLTDSNRNQYITLGGYAGTGKTTLMSHFRKELQKKREKAKVAFCSYTGKAAQVLKTKLVEGNSLLEQDSVTTIHSLIYSPMTNGKNEIIGWEKKEKIDTDLIIVDEASMVDYQIWNDLLSYNKLIIAVGDHGQLPPINGKFNLMDKPEIKLERIHRQAEGNPIIHLSIDAREKGIIEPGNYGGKVMKLKREDPETQEIIGELLSSFKPDMLVLCGYNTTRVKLNNSIRTSLEILDIEPVVNDRVICLRNNHQKEVYNGILGTIRSINREDNDWFFAEIEMDGKGDNFRGMISSEQFNSTEGKNYTNERSKTLAGDLFDFGYAITVHKAQGSQAKRVILFEERFQKMDDEMWRRWLYTAVTRAEEELYIVGS